MVTHFVVNQNCLFYKHQLASMTAYAIENILQINEIFSIKKLEPIPDICSTDKETDESWDIRQMSLGTYLYSIILKINFGLWAVGWAGL